MNYPAIILFLLIIGAGVFFTKNIILLGIGIIFIVLIILGILQRYNDIKKSINYKFEDDKFFIKNKENKFIELKNITSVSCESLSYADPYRPITMGYPSIVIKSNNKRYEILFPYWLDELRDLVATEILNSKF